MTVRKTGAEHIKSLQDGRTVFIDGKRVADVTEHPAFSNSVRSAASLYDVQARPENLELIDWNGATGLVDKLMSSYDLGGELDAGH
jgi:aromatic ring hydroxylase